MDEPTNHIDLQGKEELENDLMQEGISILFTSHDQRFIENIATRFWWIHDGQLLEIHDLSQYFACMNDQPLIPVTGSHVDASLPSCTVGILPRDEEALLERLCELEKLLIEDRARKQKFQKPRRQQQWQAELDALMDQLG
jgi:ATPase subunit of ABC transporter with duplicated ATPase domains